MGLEGVSVLEGVTGGLRGLDMLRDSDGFRRI